MAAPSREYRSSKGRGLIKRFSEDIDFKLARWPGSASEGQSKRWTTCN